MGDTSIEAIVFCMIRRPPICTRMCTPFPVTALFQSYQCIFGGGFVVSTVVGPVIGGFFVEHLSWRWIFYIILPLDLAALGVIAIAFTSPAERRRPAIDVSGAALMAIALTGLVLFTDRKSTRLNSSH